MCFDYAKLNEICYDESHIVGYFKFKSYILFDDEEESIYSFENMEDYPQAYNNKNMVAILSTIEKDCPLDETISKLKLPIEIVDELIDGGFIVSDSSNDEDVEKEVMKLSKLKKTEDINMVKVKNIVGPMKKCKNEI